MIECNPYFSRVLYYDIALVYYKAGNYQKAMKYFKDFESLLSEDINKFGYNGTKELTVEKSYIKKLPRNILACETAMDHKKFLNIKEVTNLGAPINSAGNEYFPFLSNDQQTLFYTSSNNNFSDENLYYSKALEEDLSLIHI